jgi:serine-type D-Ala-D-Ala carboxypeptidase/endopeptidase (penicillin-binding protein 4)
MKVTVAIVLLLLTFEACGPSGAVQRSEVPPRVSSITLTSNSPYPRVKHLVDGALPDSLFPPATVGIVIASVESGEMLYELNARSLFTPASNEKLLTAGAGLALLGKDYAFHTSVSVDSAKRQLILKGSGDPLLKLDDLDSLARIVSGKIPRDRSWRLAGDMSFFDDIPWGKGWMWDDQGEAYNMVVSPLSINANAVTVQLRPGKLEDAPIRVTTVPPSAYFSIENTGTTPVDTPIVPLEVRSRPGNHSTVITIAGQMLHRDSLLERDVAVWDPGYFALTLLAEKLRLYGCVVDTIILDTLPAKAQFLGAVSHRMDSVVTYMNKESDNLSAENIVKTIAAVRSGTPGTTEMGTELMRQFLASAGVDTGAIVIADGSGLSRYNLVSPQAVVTLLMAMMRSPENSGTYIASLPVAGVDGTLRNRMKGTRGESTVRAKTGSLTGVSSLSGYVRTADGELLAFSFMTQNFPGTVRPYRNVKDALAVVLARMNLREMRR